MGEIGDKGKPERHGDRDEKHREEGADKGKRDDDRKNDQGAKTDDKSGEPGGPNAGKHHGPEGMPKERWDRWKKQQELERNKIKTALRGHAMNEPMKQELERHARRMARLERIKAVATEAKDTATVDRVNKLIEMESARHDRFTSHFDPTEDKGSKDDKRKNEPKDDKGPKEDKAGAK
jgi:hypothetical protein